MSDVNSKNVYIYIYHNHKPAHCAVKCFVTICIDCAQGAYNKTYKHGEKDILKIETFQRANLGMRQ